MPPGTGDIHLTIVQTVPVTGVIVVTTPQTVALADAKKGIAMFEQAQLKVPVIGLVENMRLLHPAELPDNKYYLFGKDGGKDLASDFRYPLPRADTHCAEHPRRRRHRGAGHGKRRCHFAKSVYGVCRQCRPGIAMRNANLALPRSRKWLPDTVNRNDHSPTIKTHALTQQQLLGIATNTEHRYIYTMPGTSRRSINGSNAFAKTDTRFFYACKALTNIHILRHIKNIGCGVDCSSINEVKLALHAGFDPGAILYTSNGIHFSEIEEAQRLGVRINIDSLSNLEKFGKKYGHSYPVGIRLRPNIMGGGNLKVSTGHDKSKFGIPVDQLDNNPGTCICA